MGLAALDAQWKTQEIELSAGKNAIYLTVQPEPREWDTLLQNFPQVERVWMWNRRLSSIQFTVSPDIPLATTTDWQVWVPRNHPEAFLRNLSTAIGNMAYIVEVKPGTPSFTWRVKGQPLYPKVTWNRHALNLVGFNLNPQSPPTLQQFLSHSADIEETVRSLDESAFEYRDGEVRDLRTLLLRQMKPGHAYWLRSGTVSDYAGPLAILPSSDPGIDFGILLTEREVHFRNDSPRAALTVTILHVPSELPPNNFGVGTPDPRDLFDDTEPSPEVAGMVPLSWYDSRVVENAIVGWVPFEGALIRELQPGEEWRLRLAVRRADVSPYTPIGFYDAAYQSLLRVEDSLGMNLYYLPVSATTAELAE